MTDFPAQLQKALAPTYDLDREITGGGMSRVFVAIERALGRRVVVKVLPPELAAGVNKDRFRREIQLAAQLQHPHIVPLLNAGESEGLLWYTMPFIEGESLREALLRHGRFAARDVVRTLHDVVDALSYAHSRGVIHRDIKPANILTHGQHALVADFGVAKALSAAMPHSGTTSVGIAIGTPAYMAPEQLAADPDADHRVDIYAVGLLAYELLTGEQPFTGASPQATMAAQLTRMPTPLDQCCPDVPEELSAMIMGCLAKSPEERPQNARALLEQLDTLTTPQGGMPSTPRSGGTPAAYFSARAGAAPAAPARPSRRTAVLAGIGLLAVVGGLVALSQRGVRVGDRVASDSTQPVAGAAADSARPAPPARKSLATAPAPGTTKGAPRTDSARAAAPVLTREDSLRIADAVHRRVAAAERAEARQPDPGIVNLDSLRREITRQNADPAARDIILSAFRAAEQAKVAEQMLRMQAEVKGMESLKVRMPVMPTPPAVLAPGARAGASAGAATGPARTSRRVAWLGLVDRTGVPQYAGDVRGVNELTRRTLVSAGYQLVDDATAARIQALTSWSARRRAADSLGIAAVIGGSATRITDGLRAEAQVLDVGRNRVRAVREDGDEENPRAIIGIVGEIVGELGDVDGLLARGAPAGGVIGWEGATVGSGGGSGTARSNPAPGSTWVVSGKPRMILFDLDDRTGASGGAEVARLISDSLRRVVRRTGLEVVDDANTRAVPSSTTARRAAGTRHGASAIAAGALSLRRDSLVVQLSVRDMRTSRTFETFQARVPADAPLDAVGSLAATLLAHLGRVEWSAPLPQPPAAPVAPRP